MEAMAETKDRTNGETTENSTDTLQGKQTMDTQCEDNVISSEQTFMQDTASQIGSAHNALDGNSIQGNEETVEGSVVELQVSKGTGDGQSVSDTQSTPRKGKEEEEDEEGMGFNEDLLCNEHGMCHCSRRHFLLYICMYYLKCNNCFSERFNTYWISRGVWA